MILSTGGFAAPRFAEISQIWLGACRYGLALARSLRMRAPETKFQQRRRQTWTKSTLKE